MLSMKERLESALSSAWSENNRAYKEFGHACKRRDQEGIKYWESAWRYWSGRIDEISAQLKKEVNG